MGFENKPLGIDIDIPKAVFWSPVSANSIFLRSHAIPIFNSGTKFISKELAFVVESVVSLFFFPLLVARIIRLKDHQRGSLSMAGQVSFLAALLAPILRVAAQLLANDSVQYLEILITIVGLTSAGLSAVQNGRVAVSSPELLMYWLCIDITSSIHAIDAVLNTTKTRYIDLLIVMLGLAAFVAELLAYRPRDRTSFDNHNVFSKITLGFLNPLLELGLKRRPERKDIPSPPRSMNSYNNYSRISLELESRFENKFNNYRLILALISMQKFQIFGQVGLNTISEFINYTRPLVLSWFLSALQRFHDSGGPLYPSVYIGLLAGIMPLVVAGLKSLSLTIDSIMNITTRTALTGLVYRKALRLSPQARKNYSSAKIMNIINVDTELVDGAAQQTSTIVTAPIAIIISTWQLYYFLGRSMFSAAVLYGIFAIYPSYVSRILFRIFPKIMKVKDRRTTAIANIFSNIKSLKLYAWEQPFYERVVEIRREEMQLQQRTTAISASLSSMWTCLSDIVATAVFITFLYFQMGELSPEVVFPTLSLLSSVSAPFMALPMAVTAIGRAMASQKRICELLSQEEVQSENYHREDAEIGLDSKSVVVRNATITWYGSYTDENVALKNISFNASNGDLVCVVGRVGSGKSALLKALCDEMVILDGSITLKGRVAYCSQESWLQNQTIRENILFGNKYHEEVYNSTLEACDLVRDFNDLPRRDETVAGERGISLSGGQKARIALARAVYSRSDVYLLDDVLSAVDEHTASHLIDKLFSRRGLLASKTVILSTNNIQVLSNASKIIALQDKMILEQSTLREIEKHKDTSAIYKLIKEFDPRTNLETRINQGTSVEEATTQSASTHHFHHASLDERIGAEMSPEIAEEAEGDSISLNIFRRYFDAAGNWSLILGTMLMLASVIVTNSVAIWLGVVSDKHLSSLSDARGYVAVYLILTFLSAASIFVGIFWFLGYVAVNVSKRLHNQMLWNTMRSPMRMFDITPLGRIINRFSGDVSILDTTLPTMLYYFVRSIMNTVIGIITIIAGAPVTIFVIIFLLFVGNTYRKLYVPASRHISRLASAANSPILSHIEESVKGVSILRAFGRTDQYVDMYEHRTDYWIVYAFVRANLRRWLAWRIQAMTAFLGISATLAMILFVQHNVLMVSFVGVVMHFVTRVGIMVAQIIFGWADLEVSGVALERVLEYIDCAQEVSTSSENVQLSTNWPAEGRLLFDNVSARYRPNSPDILRNVTFSVNPGEKIGIVGRTGSGKSSLTLTIFRIIEASAGHIYIDGVDISTLNLQHLRSRLSIIPQDAQIFEGTLRDNLDPYHRKPDQRLWEILDMCHLKRHFENLSSGLDTSLAGEGYTLSRGQAQLICLGRALAHDSKILVLDEATASVDVYTDALIQQTIRTVFAGRTILTIAHRLNTIMDSDRVLVLDKGEVKEFDTPQRLLESKGLFYELYNAHELEIFDE